MEHSSQATKGEYGNKHQPDMAKKMTNMWEQKIGTDVVHEGKPGSSSKKPSPTTVVNSSGSPVGKGVALTQAGSAKASDKLKKTKTKELVQNFEKMASKTDQTEPEGNVHKMVKKLSSRADTSISHTSSQKNASTKSFASAVAKDDLYDLITKLSASVSEMSTTLKELKTRVDAM